MTDEASYDIRIHGIRKVEGKRGTTYTVRWKVDGKSWQKTFSTAKLADGHRSDLLTAARRGEKFDVATGLPRTMVPEVAAITWLDHATDFVRMKWPDAAPKYRKSLAESLTLITLSLVIPGGQQPDRADLRKCLFRWAFTAAGANQPPPEGLREAASWVQTHSRPVSDLENSEVLRNTLEIMSKTLTGHAASDATFMRRRSALHNCLEYAVERKRLAANPLAQIRRKRRPPTPAIDRRRVANPFQARDLLMAVRKSDPELEAFFATLYYAGPRPGEVLNLRRTDCTLPEHGWGQLLFASSYQRAGHDWTDSGDAAEERQLKHRAVGDTRPVPAHPELVDTLRRHIAEHELGPDGRLFVARTIRGGSRRTAPFDTPVSMNTIYRAWHRARKAALSPEQFESLLAQRPYDLRHACLSTWLNAGVAPVQVAEWAGHSVAVLLSVYAKCLDGQEAAAMLQIENALKAERESKG
ncbi:MAG: tyrosine-type recombinase/integrase [Kineosporiaceae bacterium]|nr:tyrosine-type recombinase/integrase [Aeromicrobium sp.]